MSQLSASVRVNQKKTKTKRNVTSSIMNPHGSIGRELLQFVTVLPCRHALILEVIKLKP